MCVCVCVCVCTIFSLSIHKFLGIWVVSIFLETIESETEVTQMCPTHSEWPHRWQPTRLLRPWDFPGKSTGVGCCCLLYGTFLTQGLNPGLLHCRQTLYCLSHLDYYKHSYTGFCVDICFSLRIDWWNVYLWNKKL